jgi:hypothetical protein
MDDAVAARVGYDCDQLAAIPPFPGVRTPGGGVTRISCDRPLPSPPSNRLIQADTSVIHRSREMNHP